MEIHQYFKAFGTITDKFEPEDFVDFIDCENEQELRDEIMDRLTYVQPVYQDFTLDVDHVEIDEDDMKAFIEEWRELKGL
jgi:hypothetical protein